jgi:hypothetical protein
MCRPRSRHLNLTFPGPAPADQLAVAVLALSNGIAIEQLADADTVDTSILG